MLTCGRRLEPLQQTKDTAPVPEAVHVVCCDIGTPEGRRSFLAALPPEPPVRLLVQNAAIGDPGDFSG